MLKTFRSLCLCFICLFFVDEVLAENVNLFKIERNKNANVVVYDVKLDSDNKIDRHNPVDSYWILYAKQGQHKKITTFEKQAYGYNVTLNNDGSYTLILKAVKDRPIRIIMLNDKPKAEILINKKKAYLSSVYVHANNNTLIPKVTYLVLNGTDIDTEAQVSEKINI